MSNYLDALASGDWVYFKLYLGQAIDRLDQLIVKLGKTVPKLNGVSGWFYIRYFDERGVHVRLRVQTRECATTEFKNEVYHLCVGLLNALHELLSSTYYPMVVPVGYEEAVQRGTVTGGHNDVQIVSDQYEPEMDKFGGVMGVKIAEKTFQVSSEIACSILADEAQGFYSRKDLIPILMSECFHTFMPVSDEAAFWREYSFYWLGGNSPAAGDWREKFFRKGEELADQDIAVVAERTALSKAQRGYLQRWRTALDAAAAHYRELRDIVEANPEVLSFNFIHLMNNRLGIASLEEAYMATLLEQRARK